MPPDGWGEGKVMLRAVAAKSRELLGFGEAPSRDVFMVAPFQQEPDPHPALHTHVPSPVANFHLCEQIHAGQGYLNSKLFLYSQGQRWTKP